LLAVVADGDRSALLPRIRVPTHVIHGQEDPLVPVACGIELVKLIPDATVDIVPGMGHDLPLPLLERFAQGILVNARRSTATPASSEP
jgi:pimeloyl-ACP methyl ester carboxylesterase